MIKGSYLCNSVQIEAQPVSHNVGVCHCSVYRKWIMTDAEVFAELRAE
jgi:hypothetical protein